MLASPLWPALLAFALAIACALAGRRRFAVWCTGVAAACVVAMTPLVANALLSWLERPYRDATPRCDGGDTIVVLAGGFDRAALADDDFDALSDASVRRLVRALVLLRESPTRRLLVTGGGAWRVPESAVLAVLARALGARPDAVAKEVASRDTWEGAQAVASLTPRASRVWLVSSAWHLRRATLAYEAAGLVPCAVPADHRLRASEGWWALLPQASGLYKTELALHEIAGIAWYRWRAYRADAESSASS